MHGHLTALSTYISVTCILYFVAPCFSDDETGVTGENQPFVGNMSLF